MMKRACLSIVTLCACAHINAANLTAPNKIRCAGEAVRQCWDNLTQTCIDEYVRACKEPTGWTLALYITAPLCAVASTYNGVIRGLCPLSASSCCGKYHKIPGAEVLEKGKRWHWTEWGVGLLTSGIAASVSLLAGAFGTGDWVTGVGVAANVLGFVSGLVYVVHDIYARCQKTDLEGTYLEISNRMDSLLYKVARDHIDDSTAQIEHLEKRHFTIDTIKNILEFLGSRPDGMTPETVGRLSQKFEDIRTRFDQIAHEDSLQSLQEQSPPDGGGSLDEEAPSNPSKESGLP